MSSSSSATSASASQKSEDNFQDAVKSDSEDKSPTAFIQSDKLKTSKSCLDYNTKDSSKLPGEQSTDFEDDNIERYKRLLQEAKASVSDRDILIDLLQNQLKKLEDLYKQNFNETQDVRHKLCIAVQELGNLKQINEKYKEDISALLKSNEESTSDKIKAFQEEVEHWKSLKQLGQNQEVIDMGTEMLDQIIGQPRRYNELLIKTESMKGDSSKIIPSTSKEIQVELPQDLDLKQVLDTIISHYTNIEEIFKTQHDKLEFLIRKIFLELNKPEMEGKKIANALETIAEETSSDESYGSTSLQAMQTIPKEMDESIINYYCPDRATNDTSAVIISELRSEIEILECQLQQSEGTNKQQMKEIRSLKENDKNSSHYIPINDSLIKLLKEENHELKSEIDQLRSDMEQLVVAPKEEDLKSITAIRKSCSGSKVCFAITGDQVKIELQTLQSEIEELLKENSQLRQTRPYNDEIEKLSLEVIQLRGQLKQRDDEAADAIYELESLVDTKSNTINKLTSTNSILKSDYEVVLQKNKEISKELKEKLNLNDGIPDTKSFNELSSKYAILQIENDKFKEELNIKEKHLHNLQLEIEELQLINKGNNIATANKRLTDFEECSCYLEDIEEQLTNSKQLIQKLTNDKEKLNSKLNEMSKTLEQYKEQAEFKKLENDKLRTIENQLQCTVCNMKSKNEALEKDLHQELVKTATKVSEITNKYNAYKMECECTINKLNNDIETSNDVICRQNKEISQIKDQNNQLKVDMQELNHLHQKCVCANDKTMNEVKTLFRQKENEVDELVAQCNKCLNNAQQLEEENCKIKEMFKMKCNSVELVEFDFRSLEGQYSNEKRKNRDIGDTLESVNKELNSLKERMHMLLTEIIPKMCQLKGSCATGTNFNQTVDSILMSIRQFYESTYSSKYDSIASVCLNENPKFREGTKETQTLSKSLNNISNEDMLIKRKFLAGRVSSINTKLKALDTCPSAIMQLPKRVLSSTSDLSNPTKSNEKAVNCKCDIVELDKKDLIFQHKYYSEEIRKLDEELDIYNSSGIIDSTQIPYIDQNSLECMHCNFDIQKIMQHISAGLYEMRENLCQAENRSNNKCEPKNNLEEQIKDLQEQLKTMVIPTHGVKERSTQSSSNCSCRSGIKDKLINLNTKADTQDFPTRRTCNRYPESCLKTLGREDPHCSQSEKIEKPAPKTENQVASGLYQRCPEACPKSILKVDSSSSKRASMENASELKEDQKHSAICTKKKSESLATGVPEKSIESFGQQKAEVISESKSVDTVKIVVPTLQGLLESVIQSQQVDDNLSIKSEKLLNTMKLSNLSEPLLNWSTKKTKKDLMATRSSKSPSPTSNSELSKPKRDFVVVKKSTANGWKIKKSSYNSPTVPIPMKRKPCTKTVKCKTASGNILLENMPSYKAYLEKHGGGIGQKQKSLGKVLSPATTSKCLAIHYAKQQNVKNTCVTNTTKQTSGGNIQNVPNACCKSDKNKD